MAVPFDLLADAAPDPAPDAAPDAAPDPADVIRHAWASVAGAEHQTVADDLIERYAEAHRRYHTATHIAWVLHHVDELLAADPEAAAVIDRDAVVAAAIFHDAIYDVGSSNNEAESAALAARALACVGWDDRRIAEVVASIFATAGHAATTEAEAVLLDADLAVLGGSLSSYRAYVAAVRAEYAGVSDSQWRVGRAAVLQGLLDRDHLFATPTMRADREQQAHANIGAELYELAADGVQHEV